MWEKKLEGTLYFVSTQLDIDINHVRNSLMGMGIDIIYKKTETVS